jgi:hypothetical protein
MQLTRQVRYGISLPYARAGPLCAAAEYQRRHIFAIRAGRPLMLQKSKVSQMPALCLSMMLWICGTADAGDADIIDA